MKVYKRDDRWYFKSMDVEFGPFRSEYQALRGRKLHKPSKAEDKRRDFAPNDFIILGKTRRIWHVYLQKRRVISFYSYEGAVEFLVVNRNTEFYKFMGEYGTYRDWLARW